MYWYYIWIWFLALISWFGLAGLGMNFAEERRRRVGILQDLRLRLAKVIRTPPLQPSSESPAHVVAKPVTMADIMMSGILHLFLGPC